MTATKSDHFGPGKQKSPNCQQMKPVIEPLCVADQRVRFKPDVEVGWCEKTLLHFGYAVSIVLVAVFTHI